MIFRIWEKYQRWSAARKAGKCANRTFNKIREDVATLWHMGLSREEIVAELTKAIRRSRGNGPDNAEATKLIKGLARVVDLCRPKETV